MVKKFLVVSGTRPGELGVGGVVLGDLEHLMPDSFEFITLPKASCRENRWLSRRFETGYRPVRGIFGEAIGFAARSVLYRRHCRNLIEEILASSMRFNNIEALFAVLDCPTVIDVCRKVSKKLGIPLRILVWDAPELLANEYNLDRWSKRQLLRQIRLVASDSVAIGVMSENMRRVFRERYDAKSCFITRHGLSKSDFREVTMPLNKTTLIIGFTGSITAPDAFDSLIAALDKHNWVVEGREITLQLSGACRYTLESRSRQRISYLGWSSTQQEAVELLSQCDILYLPQPFESRLSILSEQSFPNKLSTYLAAGRPVLLHAPTSSSLSSFFSQYPFGAHCKTVDINDLWGSLILVAQCKDAPKVTEAIERARSVELNQEVFLRSIRQLLDLGYV